MREPDVAEPFWLREAFAGRFEAFDSFLEQCGMDLNRLAGLPDPAELLPDFPVDVRNSEVARKHRACRDPESFAAHLLELPSITAADALTLFRKLPKEAASRATKPRRDECSFAAGVFVHGGVLGLRRTCSQHPKSVQVFTRLIRESHPKLIFASFTVNQNVGTLPHTDSHNAETEPNFVLALSRFRRGGIWVETSGGSHALSFRGQKRFGEVLSLQEGPQVLEPRRLHATEDWTGTRVVLVAFTVRSSGKLDSSRD